MLKTKEDLDSHNCDICGKPSYCYCYVCERYKCRKCKESFTFENPCHKDKKVVNGKEQTVK